MDDTTQHRPQSAAQEQPIDAQWTPAQSQAHEVDGVQGATEQMDAAPSPSSPPPHDTAGSAYAPSDPPLLPTPHSRQGRILVGIAFVVLALIAAGGLYSVHARDESYLAGQRKRDRMQLAAQITHGHATMVAQKQEDGLHTKDMVRNAQNADATTAAGIPTIVARTAAALARATDTTRYATATASALTAIAASAQYDAQSTATAQAVAGMVMTCTDADYNPASGCTSTDAIMPASTAQNGRLCVNRNAYTGSAYVSVTIQQTQLDQSLKTTQTLNDTIPNGNSGTCWKLGDVLPTDPNASGQPQPAVYTLNVTFAGSDLDPYSFTLHS